MAKRKPSIQIEEVLPDDNRLTERGNVWKEFMQKYAKTEDKTSGLKMDIASNMLDYYPSDHSDASDVETGEDEDYSLGDREEFDKRLTQVVAERKRNWADNGLLELMTSIEDTGDKSHVKVQKWLFNLKCPFDMTQANEMVMTEENADGDRREYHRKQEVTVSRGGADDADSMYSVDTAQYILENTKKRHSSVRIKTTIIQNYNVKRNNPFANLPAITGFPFDNEPSTSRLLRVSRSDSAFETSEDKSQNRSNERRSAVSPVVARAESSKTRKKVFKKTAKKQSTKSASSKRNVSGSQQFEEALKSCVNVKKVVPSRKSRRIDWLETTHIQNSSSSENEAEVKSSPRVTRSSAKEQSKRDQLNNTSGSTSVTPESSPRKKAHATRRLNDSPGKNVDLELLQPFESFCLSPTKRVSKSPQVSQQDKQDKSIAVEAASCKSPTKRISTPTVSEQDNKSIAVESASCQSPTKGNSKPQPVAEQVNNTVDQTANMTDLFSATNDKIVNSTGLAANSTVSSNRSIRSGTTYWNRYASGYRDESQSIVVYAPKTITPNCKPDDTVRITYPDLTLVGVNKPRHLEKFKTFNYLVHPNSTVRFFPSDSEDDEPPRSTTSTIRAPSTTNAGDLSCGDDDLSCDEEDFILTFDPRKDGRLNIIEYPYKPT